MKFTDSGDARDDDARPNNYLSAVHGRGMRLHLKVAANSSRSVPGTTLPRAYESPRGGAPGIGESVSSGKKSCRPSFEAFPRGQAVLVITVVVVGPKTDGHELVQLRTGQFSPPVALKFRKSPWTIGRPVVEKASRAGCVYRVDRPENSSNSPSVFFRVDSADRSIV